MTNRLSLTLWMPIPFLHGYEASSDGRIRSLDREVRHKLGGVMKIRGRELKPYPVGAGYLTFRTTNKTYLISRVVLEAFKGPPSSNEMQACHNNGILSDNRVSNLRWDTPRGNAADKRAHGTETCGERHPSAKLTQSQVESIRKDTRSEREIGLAYNISESHAGSVRRGLFWKN